jgi:uncharacterized protein DUF4145
MVMVKVLCDRCRRTTRHAVIHEVRESYTPENDPEMRIDHAAGTWQIIRCNGCDDVSFREFWISSEDPEGAERIFPPRSLDSRQAKTFINVPFGIIRIYREMIDAYNVDAATLCAVGVRAIVEAICRERRIASGPVEQKRGGKAVTVRRTNLEGKVEGLREMGFVTADHANALHETRLFGNEAAHELQRPGREVLKSAVEIIEHTLENMYELTAKARSLGLSKQVRKP